MRRAVLYRCNEAESILQRALGAIEARSLSSSARGITSGDSGGIGPALAYCVEQVKAYDRENYFWCTQIDKELRPAVFALHAFNVETAIIPDHVKQAPLAQIRYQWWRDAVKSIHSDKTINHPVIKALSQEMGDSASARYRLQRMISTREADLLNGMPPNSMEELEEYAEGTVAQLLLLQLETAGIRSSTADHAASHLGKAVGISNLLRGTLHHAARRRTYLPVSSCAANGVSQESVYRGQPSEGLNNVIFEVASVAKGHLNEARKLHSKLPPEASQLMLPAVACGLYLNALERNSFNIFTPELQKGGYSPLRHVLTIKYHLWRESY